MPQRTALRDIALFERPVAFVRPFRSGAAPASEAQAFLSAHPDLYVLGGTRARLSIRDGDLLTGSLTTAGFASGAHPDWVALAPLQPPKAKFLKEQAV
jgi:hypothetical protein